MIWNLSGHEIALVGAGHSYEDSFESFLRLVCITCWEDQTRSGDFIIWQDPDELNPLHETVEVDHAATLNTLVAHIAEDVALGPEVVEAAVMIAGLSGDVGAGVDVVREQAILALQTAKRSDPHA